MGFSHSDIKQIDRKTYEFILAALEAHSIELGAKEQQLLVRIEREVEHRNETIPADEMPDIVDTALMDLGNKANLRLSDIQDQFSKAKKWVEAHYTTRIREISQ